MKVKCENEVAQSCPTPSNPMDCSPQGSFLATPWTVAHKAPLSMGFSSQEYWSGVPLPSPDDDIRELQKITYEACLSGPYSLLQKLDECINVYSISWKRGSERLYIDIQRRKKLNLQLTVEQNSFELHRSSYKWIFFPPENTIVLYNSQLVESTNTELCLWRTTIWVDGAGPRTISQALFKGQLYLKMLTAKTDFEGKMGFRFIAMQGQVIIGGRKNMNPFMKTGRSRFSGIQVSTSIWL